MKKIKNFLKKHKYKLLGASLLPLITFLVLDVLFPLRVDISYSQLILAEDRTVLHAFLSEDDKWRLKTELHEITPELRETIIFKEDKYFYYHLGINPIAIVRAMWNNTVSGRRTSGASTITMQVARLLYPKKRTYSNKILEMFHAIQLEWHYSKDEILQLYLNLVPYGGNIEGVKSASWLYLRQMPNKLSLAQITALAIIPNRPTSLTLGKNNEDIKEARNRWLKRFETAHLFEKNRILDAINEPLESHYQGVTSKAPHLALRLHQQYPSQAILNTNINSEIQAKATQIALNYTRRTCRYGIHNAAVLVIDNEKHQVLAYLGSSDFSDKKNSGEVDGVRAYRSPGSTLKPLLYGLCFDKGLLTPKRVVSDVPSDFDGYTPQNFNGKFNGEVSIETALAYSLNVPAVKALQNLGVHSMIDKLKKMQFRYIERDERKLGLSLALGGCGVSLEELGGLFSAFSNEGTYHKLSYLTDSQRVLEKLPQRDSVQVFSPSSSYMLTEILTKVERPELPSDYHNSRHVPKIAWKTGTSYGRRDAWSIGYNKKYTIAVWLGNFSGEGVYELTGAAMATPLLFKLFNVIDYDSNNEWIQKPQSLRTRKVCSQTGLTPAHFCRNIISDYFIPTVSTPLTCEHLRYVFVKKDESQSFCTYCLPKKDYKKRLYPNFSPEVIAYKDEHQLLYDKIPAHYPECTHIFKNEEAPKIVSPIHGREYFTQDQNTELMLACQTANDVKEVYWYINDKFYQRAQAHEKVFFVPPKGKVKISCSDDKGRNTNSFVEVR